MPIATNSIILALFAFYSTNNIKLSTSFLQRAQLYVADRRIFAQAVPLFLSPTKSMLSNEYETVSDGAVEPVEIGSPRQQTDGCPRSSSSNTMMQVDNISAKAESSLGLHICHFTGSNIVRKSRTNDTATNTPTSNVHCHLEERVNEDEDECWSASTATTVHGNSIRTWSLASLVPSSRIERIQMLLKTEGRPFKADIEVWQGPDNTPQKIQIYVEDGRLRPFRTVIETPCTVQHSIAVRNTASMEFPVSACVKAEFESRRRSSTDQKDHAGSRSRSTRPSIRAGIDYLYVTAIAKRLQGADSVYSRYFDSKVEAVQLLLRTDGRPLFARIELLQGPNNRKQEIRVYNENGIDRPFCVLMPTPGNGNMVRIINTAPLEYPITVFMEPYHQRPDVDESMERVHDDLFLVN